MLDSYITPIGHNGFALEASVRLTLSIRANSPLTFHHSQLCVRYAVHRQILSDHNVREPRRSIGDYGAPGLYSQNIVNGDGVKYEPIIHRKAATNLACPPKLKPLIIPEQGTVALGLLTPVEETPDDSEASSSKIIRPLPVPSRRNNPNRPRAQSTATQSTVSRLFPKLPTTRRDVIQIIPDPPAVVASTTIERLVGSDFEAPEMFMEDHQHDLPSKHTFRSGASSLGSRNGRNLADLPPIDAGTVSAGRISVSKTTRQPSHHFTRSERPFLSRARANTSVALPGHQIQNRYVSPTATSSTTASLYSANVNTSDTQSPKIPITKVKALPSPPVVLEKIEGNRFHAMSKDKGKGKALDFAGQSDSQNDYQGSEPQGSNEILDMACLRHPIAQKVRALLCQLNLLCPDFEELAPGDPGPAGRLSLE
ncbi:hypothetical protein C8J55DRAFT_553766 [Lentinula edodes]|uniref:Uncharacterized protein n=1 Tax=Lentinula lateritia TaxID=40482 RepID=A0A9W9B3Q8_9AGAR|nr:hypothetical protein C8J55DRAFT_553766 [Lentinula edodes]